MDLSFLTLCKHFISGISNFTMLFTLIKMRQTSKTRNHLKTTKFNEFGFF